MTTPDVHMLTGPYVLNALPEDERIGFEAHLADCPSCRSEVAELREAANKLGTAVATPPPAALKARVLSEIAATRQLPPIVTDTDAELEPAEVATPLRARRTRRSMLALAAAALAVAATGGIAIDQYRDSQEVEQQNRDLAGLLAQPDARTARGAVAGGGSAAVVLSARQDRAIVLLRGLPKLPDGKTYQLWLMDKSRTPHSAGLATPETTRLFTGGIKDKTALGITVENSPGAVTPTEPIIAMVQMA
ncbi:anti-sigma factor [Kribbella italica]|uniref:Regulator of SigK n=1 Tax=Kribbella italica TaxID=1540520 RepID=A0A7W9J410_9ACTN|nr:anti-sigma factor [Kribbella italica]MBB5834687.1 anti-sigma-K factor RskA [Kribbella italica]